MRRGKPGKKGRHDSEKTGTKRLGSPGPQLKSAAGREGSNSAGPFQTSGSPITIYRCTADHRVYRRAHARIANVHTFPLVHFHVWTYTMYCVHVPEKTRVLSTVTARLMSGRERGQRKIKQHFKADEIFSKDMREKNFHPFWFFPDMVYTQEGHETS